MVLKKGLGHSTFLVMTEKRWKTRDNKRVLATVLTDLSKAFDCISRELLTVKLNAYKFF